LILVLFPNFSLFHYYTFTVSSFWWNPGF